MRLVTWNCNVGNFRGKAAEVAKLSPLPDILAVQEVESLDRVKAFAGACQPTFRERVAAQGFPRRGTGMFTYTDTRLRSIQPLCGFSRYEAQRGDLVFNVVGAWAWETKDKAANYRQIHDGLDAHRDWIGERPTVVLGDFNAHASYAGTAWRSLAALMDSLNLTSAYHSFNGVRHGAERHLTHFHQRDASRGFHLDYCFIPKDWVPHLKGVDVPPFDEWRAFSDHVPVIVDLDL